MESHWTPGCSDSRGYPMREGCTGRRSRYRNGYCVERCRHEKDSGYIRAQQRGYFEGFCSVYAPVTSAGVNAAGGTSSPGAPVESSPFVSEEDEADDIPSPKLGGRVAHELRWLEETPVVR